MVYLADTHCHLHFNTFEADLDQVVQRALQIGVNRILVPGINIKTSQQAVLLSERYPQVYCAVGLHPNEIASAEPEWLKMLEEIARHPKVKAIGEIGLDDYRQKSSHMAQVQALTAQLELASLLNKPVILHSRQSINTLLGLVFEWQKNIDNEILKQFPGVLHAFEGNVVQAQQAGSHNFFIGLGGPVTYKSAVDKQNLANQVPITQILLETDAPFLTPHPFRGQRNEPARIAVIAERIAELKSMTVDEIAKQTSMSAIKLLGWS